MSTGLRPSADWPVPIEDDSLPIPRGSPGAVLLDGEGRTPLSCQESGESFPWLLVVWLSRRWSSEESLERERLLLEEKMLETRELENSAADCNAEERASPLCQSRPSAAGA